MKANMDTLKGKLREQGLKLTPQRLAIYGELASTRRHPSVEWIYHRVKKEQPTISLATVYKTLESLKKAGLATEVCSFSDSRHYDWVVSPHPHLCCTSCERVEDLQELNTEEMSRISSLAEQGTGFEVLKGRYTLYGVCPACQARK